MAAAAVIVSAPGDHRLHHLPALVHPRHGRGRGQGVAGGARGPRRPLARGVLPAGRDVRRRGRARLADCPGPPAVRRGGARADRAVPVLAGRRAPRRRPRRDRHPAARARPGHRRPRRGAAAVPRVRLPGRAVRRDRAVRPARAAPGRSRTRGRRSTTGGGDGPVRPRRRARRTRSGPARTRSWSRRPWSSGSGRSARSAAPYARRCRTRWRSWSENRRGDLDVATLAAAVNLSPEALLALFKSVVGVPPMTYLQALRVSRARGPRSPAPTGRSP